MDFWDRVRSLTTHKGYTAAYVAGESRIQLDTYNGWMYKRRMPPADSAAAIADALNTTVEYLVYGTNPQPEQLPPNAAEIISIVEKIDNNDTLLKLRGIIENYLIVYNGDISTRIAILLARKISSKGSLLPGSDQEEIDTRNNLAEK